MDGQEEKRQQEFPKSFRRLELGPKVEIGELKIQEQYIFFSKRTKQLPDWLKDGIDLAVNWETLSTWKLV